MFFLRVVLLSEESVEKWSGLLSEGRSSDEEGRRKIRVTLIFGANANLDECQRIFSRGHSSV